MTLRPIRTRYQVLTLAVLLAATGGAFAETHTTGVPVLNSRPGAAYTIYLDFAGFNYTGTWFEEMSPGNCESFNGVTGTFSSADQTLINNLWARVANSYAPFNINITTVDPAVAAGKADTDAHRQAYYETKAGMEHTVITATSWYGGIGGVSWVDRMRKSYNPTGAGAGWHTNWVFTGVGGVGGVGTGLAAGQAATHENGHALGLDHQSDYSATKVNEYSYGNNNSTNGTYAPIMGAAYYTQRGAWRLGTMDTGAQQNDMKILANDSGMNGYVEDGVGHEMLDATTLPLTGSAVNFNTAKGIIVPASKPNPAPIGASNYTQDWWTFASDGAQAVSLTVNNGNQWLVPGTADPGATLRSTLTIYNAAGVVVGTATESSSTLKETYTMALAAGNYYAKVASYGGTTQTLVSGGVTFATTYYYDVGSYFFTGSGLAVGRIINTGTVQLTASNMLDTTTNLTVNGGTLDLRGYNQQLNSLSDGGVRTGVVTNSRATSAMLTVSSASAGTSTTFGGLISGNLALVKGGLGTLALTGSNTYTGSTTIMGGTLVMGDGGTTGSVSAGAIINNSVLAFNRANALVVANPITGAGTVTQAGGGTTTLTNYAGAGALKVNAGRLAFTETTVANSKTVVTASITISGTTGAWTSTLDVGNNALVVKAPTTGGGNAAQSQARRIANQVASGLDLSNPDGILFGGKGIISATAGNYLNTTGNPLYAIGWLQNNTLGLTVGDGTSNTTAAEGATPLYPDYGPFAGDNPTVSLNDVLLKYTYWGDADLNGVVDDTDVALLINGYQLGLSGWINGDFDYNGIIDDTDVALLVNAYQFQSGPLTGGLMVLPGGGSVGGFTAAVPEPASLAVLGVGGLMLLLRRRRVH